MTAIISLFRLNEIERICKHEVGVFDFVPVFSNMVVVVDVMRLFERRIKMIEKPYYVAVVLPEMVTRAAVRICHVMQMFSGFREIKRVVRNVTVSFDANQHTIKVSGLLLYLMRGGLDVMCLNTA